MQAVSWPGRFGKKRLTILRASSRRPHRYRTIRALTMVASLSLMALVPRELIAGTIAVLVLFFFTFNLNLVAGRMFCGWGCPIGQLNRLTDGFAAQRGRRQRVAWGAVLGGFALLVSISIFHGVWIAVPIATAAALIFARVWGWSFCRKVCPIGLYYSVVQTKRPLGILFEESKCLDEGACVRACPVELDARNLIAAKDGIGGLAIDGLSENSHCLRCGACVEACEIATSKVGEVALRFGRPAIEAPIAQASVPAMVREDTKDEHPGFTSELAASPRTERSSRWLHAVTIIAIGGAIAAYTLVAAQRATRYSPKPIAADSNSRRTDEPIARTHEPRVLEPSARSREPSVLPLRIEHGAFAPRSLTLRSGDRLELINADSHLHTLHINSGARSLVHTPLLPRTAPRRVPAPPPGRYQLRCDLHSTEQAELVVSR